MPDVARCELSGAGLRVAAADAPARFIIACRDAFGNEPGPSPDLSFGLALLPANTAAANRESAKTVGSTSFRGVWEGASYSIAYEPHEAGDWELHVWCDGDGKRTVLPGSPFSLSVNAGPPTAVGSRIVDSVDALTAGERIGLRLQLQDDYGNAAPLEAGEEGLNATLLTAAGELVPLIIKAVNMPAPAESRADTKNRNASSSMAAQQQRVAIYEIGSSTEMTLKGAHVVHVTLNGCSVQGSPLELMVVPAAPIASKSRLFLRGPSPVVDVPIDLVLQLVDKYGNDLEEPASGRLGGVRIDAKAFGSKASDVTVVDCEDGSFALTFTASVAGDYKVQVRLENVEMQVLSLKVENAEEAIAHAPSPAAASSVPASCTPPVAVEAGTGRAEPAAGKFKRTVLAVMGAAPVSSRHQRLSSMTPAPLSSMTPAPDGPTAMLEAAGVLADAPSPSPSAAKKAKKKKKRSSQTARPSTPSPRDRAEPKTPPRADAKAAAGNSKTSRVSSAKMASGRKTIIGKPSSARSATVEATA